MGYVFHSQTRHIAYRGVGCIRVQGGRSNAKPRTATACYEASGILLDLVLSLERLHNVLSKTTFTIRSNVCIPRTCSSCWHRYFALFVGVSREPVVFLASLCCGCSVITSRASRERCAIRPSLPNCTVSCCCVNNYQHCCLSCGVVWCGVLFCTIRRYRSRRR